MAFRITTTGVTDPVEFSDLGLRSFSHPTVDYDLELEFALEEIRSSFDVQDAIDNNWITVQDAYGSPIESTSEAVSHGDLSSLNEDDHLQYPLLKGTSDRINIDVISSQDGEVLTFDSTSGNYINLPCSTSGTSGSSGSSGSSGTSGSSGATGTSGTSGTSGSSGTSAAGSIATSTDNKMARYNGTSGIQGTGVSVSDTDDVVLPATSSLKCPEKLVIPLNEPTSLENGCIWVV